MVALSNAATYSIVWIVVAAAVAATGYLRSAIALLIAVPIEFAVTNGPVKLLFRRERPAAVREGRVVQGVKRPRTSSFPSGHASAATMAAVALIGSGPLSFAAIALALAISASRVYLRLHHTTDVVGGIAWGLVVGSLVRATAGL